MLDLQGYGPAILEGTLLTVEAGLLSLAVAMVLGILGALAKIARSPIVRGIAGVYTTVIRSHFSPENVEVEEGDTVVWHLNNLEQAPDATHGFCIAAFNINLSLEPGEAQTIEFKADRAGTYPFYCTEFCSALHLEMMGYFQVKPKAAAAAQPAAAAQAK